MYTDLANGIGRKKQMAEINVVPYIDVMLVLLVVFMITAPLLTQGVKIELPKGAEKPLPNQKSKTLEVTVDDKGNFYLNTEGRRKPVDREELVQWSYSFLKKYPKAAVLVRGDHRARYGMVTQAILALKTAGAPAVGLVFDPPADSKK